MSKKKKREDQYFPIPQGLTLKQPTQLESSPTLTRQVVRQTIQAAYSKEMPSVPGSWHPDFGKKPKPLVSEEQVLQVTSLLQAINPRDALESALAAQFVACHISGMDDFIKNSTKWAVMLFDHSHKALDALHKYRNKGQQQMNVQYNVNQGQVVNIQQDKDDIKPEIIDIG